MDKKRFLEKYSIDSKIFEEKSTLTWENLIPIFNHYVNITVPGTKKQEC